MISCTKDSIGDFGATFKCVADFIACGIGGCLKGGGGGGGGESIILVFTRKTAKKYNLI